MTYTLQLTSDTEARAQAQAATEGIAVEEYLLLLIENALPDPLRELKTGADVVSYWRAHDLVGIWADRADITDTEEYAHKLRRQAETRSHD